MAPQLRRPAMAPPRRAPPVRRGRGSSTRAGSGRIQLRAPGGNDDRRRGGQLVAVRPSGKGPFRQRAAVSARQHHLKRSGRAAGQTHGLSRSEVHRRRSCRDRAARRDGRRQRVQLAAHCRRGRALPFTHDLDGQCLGQPQRHCCKHRRIFAQISGPLQAVLRQSAIPFTHAGTGEDRPNHGAV